MDPLGYNQKGHKNAQCESQTNEEARTGHTVYVAGHSKKQHLSAAVLGIVPPYCHCLHIPEATSYTSRDEIPAPSPITPLCARYSPNSPNGGTETRVRSLTAGTTQQRKRLAPLGRRQQTKHRRPSKLGALPALWLSPHISVVQKQNKWRLAMDAAEHAGPYYPLRASNRMPQPEKDSVPPTALGGVFALRAHCALLLDYVPPEEPPSTPLGNAVRIS